MGTLKKIEGWLTRLERGLLVGLLTFMVGMSFLQVILRVAFSTGILWGDTLLRHLVLWVGFLGAGLAAGADRQFAMDLSARLFDGRAKAAVQLACHGFAAAVSGLLLQASLAFFREEYAQHSTLFVLGQVNVPAWLFELILPGGFGLLLVHYLLKSIEAGNALTRAARRS